MGRSLRLALVVFVSALLANVGVQGLWPHRSIDWYVAVVVAAATAVTLVVVDRFSSRRIGR
ncbi:hypothetical protein BMS3Abin02_01812 [bacterium BMS3Abin02]|nr:hypothetical protein BMS3Abin02_01812 [bacterium BMS3Abin02]GBE22361.1 hypothetical protein BMS3Bbin01_01735 [bacterium BMS3Bbin01]HDH25607.1 hypothetical protein [Actinomycetota bacterium]HDK45201.1 hypothetical protein [Actinomycetota bacterium]HDL49629.1 hypothetical protein [Actinomycetota bacterium]